MEYSERPPPSADLMPAAATASQERRVDAAKVIQKAWRRHIDMQVYRYYRDLISFKNQGDPAMMLRCINPIECKYLDAASGTFVRFRLAGTKFPPNIYYKVFTRGNVVDMCANSPKNYAAPSSQLVPARERNNRVGGGSEDQQQDRSDWYRRFENNGWRLVADRVIQNAALDPVTVETSNRACEAGGRRLPTRLQREQDVRLRRKRKKIQWLQKMYHQREGLIMETADGMLRALDAAAAAAGSQSEPGREEPVEEWEVDELLSWTNALNFDHYLQHWRSTGASGSQLDALGERPAAELVRYPDCQFSIRREPPPPIQQPGANSAFVIPQI